MPPSGAHTNLCRHPERPLPGLAGGHSNCLPMLRKAAEEESVSLLRLIERVSAVNRKDPDEDLIKFAAKTLR